MALLLMIDDYTLYYTAVAPICGVTMRGLWRSNPSVLHYTLYTIHYTLHTIHYTLHTIHYTLYTGGSKHERRNAPLHARASPSVSDKIKRGCSITKGLGCSCSCSSSAAIATLLSFTPAWRGKQHPPVLVGSCPYNILRMNIAESRKRSHF